MNSERDEGTVAREGREWEDPREVAPFRFVSLLLRHWILIVMLPVVLGAVAVGLKLTEDRLYTSDATFTPHSGESSGRLGSVAAQFGVNIGGAGGDRLDHPDFFAAVIESRSVLEPLLATEYRVGNDGDTLVTSIPGLFGIETGNPGKERDESLRALRSSIESSTDLQTGLVRFEVSTPWPEVSHQLADRLLESLVRFSVEIRQSRAAAEREFAEERLEEAAAELTAAEDELQRFLQQNRSFQGSPELQFEYERLQRQATMRQQLYTALVQTYEEARINQHRNTAPVAVVETPVHPVRPDARGTIRAGLVAMAFGFILALALAFGREFLRESRERRPGEFTEFRSLLRRTWSEMRHPLRTLRRYFGRLDAGS